MVDSIGPRHIVPIPRIRRPADDEKEGGASQRRGGGNADRPEDEGVPEDADTGTRKGRLIDDQA